MTGDRVNHLFASHQLRCTRQRRALYEALHASKTHPTADELFHQVGGRIDGLSLATVYNTLEAFCEAGLAHKLPGVDANGSARYDASTHHHLHLRCRRTGAVVDVPDDLGRQLLSRIPADALQELESRMGVKISQVQIELVGEKA